MADKNRLTAFEIEIKALAQSIRQRILDLVAKNATPKVDDPDYQAFFRQLEHWNQRLILVVRELRSGEHRLGMERRQIKSVHRDERFRLTQSVSDRSRRLSNIKEYADHALYLLTQLYALALNPTDVDIHKGVFHLIESTFDTRKSFVELKTLGLRQNSATATAMISRAGQEIHPARPEAVDSLIILVLVIQLLKIWWLEQIRKERSQ